MGVIHMIKKYTQKILLLTLAGIAIQPLALAETLKDRLAVAKKERLALAKRESITTQRAELNFQRMKKLNYAIIKHDLFPEKIIDTNLFPLTSMIPTDVALHTITYLAERDDSPLNLDQQLDLLQTALQLDRFQPYANELEKIKARIVSALEQKEQRAKQFYQSRIITAKKEIPSLQKLCLDQMDQAAKGQALFPLLGA